MPLQISVSCMENISVSVRVRPLSKSEAQDAWRTVDGCTIFQTTERQDVKYTLDHVFGPEVTTQQIYDETTRPLIAKVEAALHYGPPHLSLKHISHDHAPSLSLQVVNGFNSTVFAYGQTSSGKTFTMRGLGGPQEGGGLIPMAVHDVFRLIEASQDREYLIRVSYTEVCGGRIRTNGPDRM